jgi:hypothetical protein
MMPRLATKVCVVCVVVNVSLMHILRFCFEVFLFFVFFNVFNYRCSAAGNNSNEAHQQLDNQKWKLAVHALNVLRLILCDGALGPDLNAYVPAAAQLAVRGFTAPQWAVRNSCMMVFTAVAQRAVGTDKNDSAGAAVPTVQEFFQRFPSLGPFIRAALAEASVSVDGTVMPTLYPLLLLIAKLRVAVMSEQQQQLGVDAPTEAEAEAVTEEEAIALDGGGFNTSTVQQQQQLLADLQELVTRCCGRKVQAVRVIAAKALKVLTPISETPLFVVQVLQQLKSELESLLSAGARRRFDNNALHGQLLTTRELLKSVATYITSSSGSTNRDFAQVLQTQLAEQVLPLLQAVANLLSVVHCAPLHQALLESIQHTSQALGLHYSRECGDSADGAAAVAVAATLLLVQQTRSVLPAVYLAGLGSASSVSPMPYEVWLWRDSLQALVQLSVCHHHRAYYRQTSTVSAYGVVAEHFLSLEVVMELLSHRISEVREGVLKGLLDYVSAVTGTNTNTNTAATSGVLQPETFLLTLLERVRVEREPPIAELTMRLLSG